MNAKPEFKDVYEAPNMDYRVNFEKHVHKVPRKTKLIGDQLMKEAEEEFLFSLRRPGFW